MREEELRSMEMLIKFLDVFLAVAPFIAGAYFMYLAISMGFIR